MAPFLSTHSTQYYRQLALSVFNTLASLRRFRVNEVGLTVFHDPRYRENSG
jgi:hypothetical protein